MTSTSEVDAVSAKPKKPSNSAFRQQRLPAWQPIRTTGTIIPTFFVIGIVFISVGIALLYFTSEVKEHIIDYTNCNSISITEDNGQPKRCADVISAGLTSTCVCKINFELLTNFTGKVYMYYGLTNFYQNHRRYVKSRDDDQLLGKLVSNSVSDVCEPFAYQEVNNKRIPIAPCGAIANSLFSDELTLYSTTRNEDVPLLKTGIAWSSDKETKFKNPKGSSNLKEAFKNFTKPKNWTKHIYELDPYDEDNNGFKNEDLIVWMRTAALPTFRKLYRRINHTEKGYEDGLLAGNYTLQINYSYSVSSFNGTKKMILSTTSVLGGKNVFLGIAYIVVGSLCLALGIVLFIIHKKYSKSTNMINVTPTTEYH
ncbi:cell cycle control protein 50A [Monomorium pharaonis]|uniref:cell cycle control protein 50A n=1 Tax=Monomorium pharaonis TaxID=307658 RepID=UPI00063F8F18|nr:cell cycle control protein 50A [Monomorium pharaonis]